MMNKAVCVVILCAVLSGCDDDDKDSFVDHWEYTPTTNVNLATDTLELSFELRRSGNGYAASDIKVGGLKQWETDFKDVIIGHKIGVMAFGNSKYATETTKLNVKFYNCIPSGNSLFADSVSISYGTTKSTYKSQVLLNLKEK